MIHYEVYGEGPPIVLLNGIMMSTKSWKPFIEPLSAANKLILMDFYDQGESDRHEEPYKIEKQAEAVKSVLDNLGLEKVTLTGISYGGYVSLKFALTYPSYLSRLMIFNSAARSGPWLKEMGQSWIMSMDNPDHLYAATIPVVYSKAFYNNNIEWAESRKVVLTEQVFKDKNFLDGLTRLIKSTEGYDVVDQLGKIQARTLIVASDEDSIAPYNDQKIMHEGIKNSDLVLMPGCGHASMYEKPDLFASLMLGFANTKFEGIKV